MKNRLTLLATLCFVICFCGSTWSQKKMTLIYVDSSQPSSSDVFTMDENSQIRSLVEKSANEKLFVFYSNGSKYRFARNESQYEEVLNLVASEAAIAPDIKFDKKILREFVYTEVERFQGEMDFHLFLTDRKVEDIVANGESNLVKLFPRELFAVSHGGIGAMNVVLHFNNATKRVKEDKLMDALEFFNQTYSPHINYKIVIHG